uniref:autotransporter domain-containing protein n=1 Tax=Psychrobacter sp. TaxID=56811 RepID=UPI001598D8B4|nr:autotransporter domain-containing protein [Psychrobacter sp.]QJS05109.1 autotransporter beta-domain [Psychrobacter sp.]
MNHIYRVVFNRSLGVYQCVSELAKSCGKSSGKSQIATKLILAPLAIVMLGISGPAMAVTYNNGTTTTINDDVFFVGKDTVSNAGTKLVINKLILEKTQTGQPSELSIINKGTVTVNDITGVVGNAIIKVSDQGSSFNAKNIIIGQNDGSGALLVNNNASVTADNLWLGNQELNADGGNIGNVNINNAIVNIANEVLVGAETTGSLNLARQSALTANQMRIGYNEGSIGIVNVDESTFSIGDNGLAVGLFGKGVLNIKNGGGVYVNSLMTVGDAITGAGVVNVDGASNTIGSNILADDLVIGGEGQGVMNIRNTYDVADNTWSIGLDVNQDITIGNEKTGVGQLTVDNSLALAGNIIVGNEGSGTLKVMNNGFLIVDNISRGINSTLSDVYFDHADLTVEGNQSNLFANFTDKQPIKIGSNGLILDVGENNVTINSNAVLTGNVGSVDWEGVKGGFAKIGTGTLELSTNSKQWAGETLITEGILKLNGNYTMAANESLGIALDVEDEGNLKSYGKLIVNGNADISKGELKIYASDAIKNMTGSNEWKDIVKATTRKGEFTKVSDNSPLVSFYADYSDANAVHLKMGTPPVVVPPVKPEPPVVVPPVKPEPPVVVPPVKPEPPVVVPPVVDDITFVQAVNQQPNKTALGIASVLDKAVTDRMTTGNNVLADNLISNTMNFNATQLAAAANELQPSFMGATNRIITDTNYSVSNAIMEHRPTTLKQNIWAKLIGNKGSHDAKNGVTGYEADNLGAIVGLDTPINSNLNLGVAVSYIDTDANTDGSRLDHDLTAKNWQVLGYGDYAASDATRVNFHAGAGSSDVKATRNLSVLTNSVASSDYDVDTLQAGLGISHRIGSEQRYVSPFTQVNYAHAKSDAYRETGAGVYNLNVDENKYESMRWTAGLNMSQLLTPRLAITGQLAAAIENGDKYSDITANFVDMPNDKFTTVGQEVGREIGIVGVGLSYAPTLNTTLSAGYRGEWRDNYDDQGASIALQTTF